MIDFLQRYVFAHFGYKVVSLTLAVGLWWTLAHDPIAEVEVTVPIEFHRIPTNLEISSVNIPDAQVRVRGARLKKTPDFYVKLEGASLAGYRSIAIAGILLLASFVRLTHVEKGFEAAHVITQDVSFQSPKYAHGGRDQLSA